MVSLALTPADRLIAYFVCECEEVAGRTRLVKMLYMADYHARRALGRPLSDLKYIWCHFGPWDVNIPHRLSRLVEMGVIREEAVCYEPPDKVLYRYLPGTGTVSLQFAPAEKTVLEYVCEEYSKGPLRDLLDDVVYQTEPMRVAQEQDARNQPLDMDIVNNDQSTALLVPFEELIRRRELVRSGKRLTTEDLLDRLERAALPMR